MKIENNVIGKQHQVLMQTYKTEQVILKKKQTESKDRRWGWTAQGVHWAAYSRATLKCTKSFELSSKGVLFEKKKIQWIWEYATAGGRMFPSGGLSQRYRWRIQSINSAGTDGMPVSLSLFYIFCCCCYSASVVCLYRTHQPTRMIYLVVNTSRCSIQIRSLVHSTYNRDLCTLTCVPHRARIRKKCQGMWECGKYCSCRSSHGCFLKVMGVY